MPEPRRVGTTAILNSGIVESMNPYPARWRVKAAARPHRLAAHAPLRQKPCPQDVPSLGRIEPRGRPIALIPWNRSPGPGASEPRKGAPTFRSGEALLCQDLDRARHVSCAQDDVDIVVGTRLFAQERVDRPAPVEPDFDTVLGQQACELRYVVAGNRNNQDPPPSLYQR